MIKTTVVGSYPMFDWLAALPSEQALTDATAVVLKTQELAGLDVIADVHAHPWEATQTETDRRNPMFACPGHIAVILPYFATRPRSYDENATYRYLGKHQWVALPFRKVFYIGIWG